MWPRLTISPIGSKYLCKSSSEIWLRLAILPTGSKYLCKSSSKIWPRLAFSHIESLSLISIWNERGIVRKAHNSALHASPFWFSTHSFFVNQATTRHNISENRCCAYIVRCTWSSIVIVLRLFLNYSAIHRHGCLWKWDMGHGCPVSNGSGNYHYVYEKS